MINKYNNHTYIYFTYTTVWFDLVGVVVLHCILYLATALRSDTLHWSEQ